MQMNHQHARGNTMIRLHSPHAEAAISVAVHTASSLRSRLPSLAEFATHRANTALGADPNWLTVLQNGLQHDVFAVEATAEGRTCGYLPLAYVNSILFGRFLVSLPYLNSNGVVADSPDVQMLLIDRAIELADELNVRHLELRHEMPIEHPDLNGKMTTKVHMRLALPKTTDLLWKKLDTKVRNQVRKGEKSDLTVTWGGEELLGKYYAVMSQNMRDLGTPLYHRDFFREMLHTFPGQAEICLVSAGEQPIATAMLMHGRGITEVPTASSLREFNATCANMLMYRHLLDRAVERGQSVFDFGRSTLDGSTFKFKKQWGAETHPATWQYYLRSGALGEMRPENPRYQKMIRMWQRLPIRITQMIGPQIVRGIP